MDKKYRWATEEIYATDEDWNNELEQLQNQLDFEKFRGKLNDKKEFLSCMKEQERVGRILEKLSTRRP